MQSVPGYPTDLTVTEPAAVVTINGAPLEVESVKISRELSSSLPQQVVSASGMTAATGDVSWNVGPTIATRSAHPWDGTSFPPKPSDTVAVDMGYGAAVARQLTGKVDSSNGAIADGRVSSELVDAIDKLDRPVWFPPHMIVMPPWQEGGAFLACNNLPIFTTDRILRACGFFATPPAEPNAIMSAPLMGSAWPEVGKLLSANQATGEFPPSFSPTQWGMGANSIIASYEPIVTSAGPNRIDDKVLQITVKVRDIKPAGQPIDVLAWWGTSRIRLRVTGNRDVQAIVNEGTTGYFIATMSAAVAATADVFTLRVNNGGNYTIYANNGANVSGTRPLTSVFTTTNITSIQIAGQHLTSPHIGGVQVSWYSRPTWEATQTANLSGGTASNAGLDAVPAINGRNALEVLKEQAEAECAAMWIDEFGVFRWVNRNLLTTAEPVATLTALDDVLDIGWDSDAKGVRSAVDVKSRLANISRYATSSVTLHVGSGETLQNGESNTDIIEPGADESWFNIDPPGDTWTHAQLNRGQRTMVGGIIAKDDTTDRWAYDVNKIVYSYSMISTEKLALTHTAQGLAAGETLILKTSDVDPFLKGFRRDKPLPIIRGKARVRWVDIVTTGVTRGPTDSARLEHEVGPWVQNPLALQELANWLSEQVSAPRPVIRDLAVVPDFRRQLGDVVWVEDPDNMRIRLKVLVTGYTNTVSLGSADQSISGRILEALTPGVTNAQLDAHASKYTNQQFDTLWVGATNTQLDANPLGRG